MARGNLVRMQVQQDIYDGKSMLDEQNWFHQRHGKPDELSMKLTYLLGDNTRNFPISMMTYGNIVNGGSFKDKGNTKEMQDIQYNYPVMSRMDKAVVISESLYSAGDKPGIGNSLFEIPFTDNWVKRNYIVESERLIQAMIVDDPNYPKKKGESWVYLAQLDPALPTDYCPLSELTAGAKWAELHTVSAESESRGTEFKRVAPGKYKNQMTIVRLSHSWAGASADKVMSIKVATDKGETDLWMDLEVWQFEKKWLEALETAYWYSRYNRAANGTIALKDLLTGKVIPRGSGLLEQIPNYSTYSKLTYNKLQNTVTDALFGQSDTEQMSITLYTGLGGMREFDRVMKEQGGLVLTEFGNVSDKFITGSGRNLALGGFFDTMYHIDGHVIKVKHTSVFDNGKRAMKSLPHPETGLPLESYRMVFIDDADYDGEPNIQHVTQVGRHFQHGMVGGLTNAPRSYKIRGGATLSDDEIMSISTDQDKSSYHRLAVCGVQMKRANKSMHLECVLGL